MSEVPKFKTVDEVIEAQLDSDKFLPRDLYPRDSGLQLHECEQRIRELIGNKNIVLYNSGMSTIRDALEIAHPGTGVKILRGRELYAQTASYIDEDLGKRGARVVSVNSGNINEVKKAFEAFVPDIAFFESVANGENTPVLDLEKLLSFPILRQTNPYLIFDNTLPSNLNNPNTLLKNYPDRKITIVESGTKFYSLNKELSGIAYTNNLEILNSLRILRRRTGSMPGVGSVEQILSLLPSKDELNNRIKKICQNTLLLAYALEFAARDLDDLNVSYPNLSSHQNYEISNKISPDGISPVLFVKTLNSENLTHTDLVRRFWEDPEIRKYCDLGQSFGLDRTRIWFKHEKPYIRISGGTESFEDIKELSKAFIRVVRSI